MHIAKDGTLTRRKIHPSFVPIQSFEHSHPRKLRPSSGDTTDLCSDFQNLRLGRINLVYDLYSGVCGWFPLHLGLKCIHNSLTGRKRRLKAYTTYRESGISGTGCASGIETPRCPLIMIPGRSGTPRNDRSIARSPGISCWQLEPRTMIKACVPKVKRVLLNRQK